MKSINKLAVAAVLAFLGAGAASAQVTIIHVTGSTAYRVADVTAECAYLGAGTTAVSFGNGYNSTATSTSTLTGANYSIVYGPVGSGGAQTVFENFFNGSIAGDEALVDGVTQLTFPSAAAYSSSAGPVTQGSSTAAATTTANLAAYSTADTVAPDVAFSDVTFDTADQIILKSTDATNTQPAGSAVVGIVPFVFVVNASPDVPVSKITGLSMDPQTFNTVWQAKGDVGLSFFTGLNSDEAIKIYPLGRDVDSGTRATALAETGYQLNGSDFVTSSVNQYYPFDNSTDYTTDNNTAKANINNGFGATTGVVGDNAGLAIGYLNLVPQEIIDGYTMKAGNGGFYSGGNLAKAISASFATTSGTGVTVYTNTVLMTYLGVSDATAALQATGTNRVGAQLMAYNGVMFYPTLTAGGSFTPPSGVTTATNAARIYEGQYTFWGYEHINYNSAASTVATGVAAQLTGGIDQLSSNGVTLSSMRVSRSDDGLSVSPVY